MATLLSSRQSDASVSAGVEFLADGLGRVSNRWLRVSHRRLRPAPADHDQGDDQGDAQEYGGAGERSRHAVGQDLGRFARGIEPGRRVG